MSATTTKEVLVKATYDENKRLVSREVSANPPVTPKLKDKFHELAKTTKPLARVLAERREELGRSQADVAKEIGIKSSEFIGMVEKGYRSLDLNKIPALAGAIMIDRQDLCRLALFEAAPMMAMTLFGSSKGAYSPKPKAGKQTEEVTLTPEQVAYHAKLWSLPAPVRDNILHMIDQFSNMSGPRQP